MCGCQADNACIEKNNAQNACNANAVPKLTAKIQFRNLNAQIQDTTCSEMVLDVCTESVAAMMTNTNANLHKLKPRCEPKRGCLTRSLAKTTSLWRNGQVCSHLCERQVYTWCFQQHTCTATSTKPWKCLAHLEQQLAGDHAALAELRDTYVRTISKPRALPMVAPASLLIWLAAPAAAL